MKYTIYCLAFLVFLSYACKNESLSQQQKDYNRLGIDTSFLQRSDSNYVEGFQNGKLVTGRTTYLKPEPDDKNTPYPILRLLMPYDEQKHKMTNIGFELKKVENQVISGKQLYGVGFSYDFGCNGVSYATNPKKDSTGFIFIHVDNKRNLLQGYINATFWCKDPKSIEKISYKLPDSVVIKNLKFSTILK